MTADCVRLVAGHVAALCLKGQLQNLYDIDEEVEDISEEIHDNDEEVQAWCLLDEARGAQ